MFIFLFFQVPAPWRVLPRDHAFPCPASPRPRASNAGPMHFHHHRTKSRNQSRHDDPIPPHKGFWPGQNSQHSSIQGGGKQSNNRGLERWKFIVLPREQVNDPSLRKYFPLLVLPVTRYHFLKMNLKISLFQELWGGPLLPPSHQFNRVPQRRRLFSDHTIFDHGFRYLVRMLPCESPFLSAGSTSSDRRSTTFHFRNWQQATSTSGPEWGQSNPLTGEREK